MKVGGFPRPHRLDRSERASARKTAPIRRAQQQETLWRVKCKTVAIDFPQGPALRRHAVRSNFNRSCRNAARVDLRGLHHPTKTSAGVRATWLRRRGTRLGRPLQGSTTESPPRRLRRAGVTSDWLAEDASGYAIACDPSAAITSNPSCCRRCRTSGKSRCGPA